jgi:hypothetical protein
MTKLLAALAVAVVLAAIAVMASAWEGLGEVEISTAGWVALTAGGVLTFAIGAGLMLLIFYSNRAGFDDRPETRWPDREKPDDARQSAAPRRAPSPNC